MPSNLHAALSHLKNDVPFPADRKAIVTACNNMSDLPAEGRDRLAKTLPEGRYNHLTEESGALAHLTIAGCGGPSPKIGTEAAGLWSFRSQFRRYSPSLYWR